MSFESRYEKLNKEQKRAVDTLDGPVMVIAGPGSGKTELLSLRVANILRTRDIDPSQVLCLTFTDAGAKNMQDRLLRLIGIPAHRVAIHTFHGFALNIARIFNEDFYQDKEMTNADEAIRFEILSGILEKLPLSGPLSKREFHTEGFLYMKDILGKIGKLKQSAITPDEYLKVLETNRVCYEKMEKILEPILVERVSLKLLEKIPDAIEKIQNIEARDIFLPGMKLLSVRDVLANSLSHVYTQCTEEKKTVHFSKWKNRWIKTDSETKEKRFKDVYYHEKNVSLAGVYRAFTDAMVRKGFIDFDDMIIRIIHVMESKPGIMAQLQEQYRYILVDEFQDTNDAQMRILHQLTNVEKPNIMVVGDDDQAIYKFQGAEANNILQFSQRYDNTTIISLVKNYRSTKAIVDFAQRIISQGEDRLVNRMKNIDKQLEAANPDVDSGTIVVHEFETLAHEYLYIASEIKNKFDSGIQYSQIAIISRGHKELISIAAFLQNRNIPIQYVKRRNVLEEPHIIQLLKMAELIQSMNEKKIDYHNHLMPIVLSFPFWDLERSTLWELSIQASRLKQAKQRWIDAMFQSNNRQLKDIAGFLVNMAMKSSLIPLPEFLGELIGPLTEANSYTSPFRRYYFSNNVLKNNPSDYIQFLSSLETFVNKTLSYCQKSKTPRLIDFIEYAKIHEKNNLMITDESTYLSGNDAVHLLTTHKSKGLEFDTVFVINCQKEIWLKSKQGSKIIFPMNLNIEPSSDNSDDHLRLFFVALTRAKRHLYATGYHKKSDGKDTLQLPFLNESIVSNFKPLNITTEDHDVSHALETMTMSKPVIIAVDERTILQPLVDNYKMSVSHLNTFLNITGGGPKTFFEKNLLRFPQEKKAIMLYGSSLHKTMQAIYMFLKKNKCLPDRETREKFLSEYLVGEGIEGIELKKYFERGGEVLELYFEKARDHFSENHWIETDFASQNAMVGDVPITGKIDKIVPGDQPDAIDVYDYKTGKPSSTWEKGDDKKKITLYEYQRQLLFYKILVESSRDYAKYHVDQGHLEFLYPGNDIQLLSYKMNTASTERLRRIIMAVGKKIKNLDFPETEKYSQDKQGIIAFEDDLINNRI